MKGMVFAAGLGTRLLPLTATRPKALVELGGVAMLERVLGRMKAAGVEEVVVNVHHFSGMVTAFLRAHGDFGMRVHVSDESARLLDTGGGLVAARRWLGGDEPVVLHNADIYTDMGLGEMVLSHRASGADATLLVAPRASARQLLFDGAMRMRGWTDRRSGEVRPAGLDAARLQPLAFGGVHVVAQRLLDDLCRYAEGLTTPTFSITDYYIAACGRMDLRGLMQPAATRWHDVGSLEKLQRAQRDIADEAHGVEQLT